MLAPLVRPRVYVFIDGANVLYAQRTLGWKVSYERLIGYLQRECGTDVKCFFYIGTFSGNPAQKRFLDMLDANGYIVRTKPIKVIRTADGKEIVKGNLDIELSLEMCETAPSYNTAVLISGDGDFAAALDRVKAMRKRVLVMSTRGHIAKELLERAKYIDLRKLRGEIGQAGA